MICQTISNTEMEADTASDFKVFYAVWVKSGVPKKEKKKHKGLTEPKKKYFGKDNVMLCQPWAKFEIELPLT